MPLSSRRRSLLTWLPAAILVVVIGLVVLTTFAVQESWWAEESPAASADQKASDGSSMLTDAGFDYVNVEGIVRVRIGDGSLPADELGMGADDEKSAEFRRPVRAVIAHRFSASSTSCSRRTPSRAKARDTRSCSATSQTIVRRPRAAAARPSEAATVVFPTPPLPVT